MDNSIEASQVKSGSLSKVYIKNKIINSAKSIILDIKPEICIGKILCYEVDQEINDKFFVKSELESLLGEKFSIVIEDDDYNNTHNNIISIKNCYMYRYYHFILSGNIRMMQYEFSFQNENKKEILKNDDLYIKGININELTKEVAKRISNELKKALHSIKNN